MTSPAGIHGAGSESAPADGDGATPAAPVRASVVIPAHDEERVIGAALAQLTTGVTTEELEILVVCNGCTDRTAEVARTWEPQVRVIEIPAPSKFQALRRGDAEATVKPRVYLDADVLLGAADLRALLSALAPGVLAAAPRRALDTRKASWPVRWYYDVWEKLPQVRRGAFGRGVVAVSEDGLELIKSIPDVLSDDLAFAEALADRTVVVPDAVVRIHVPRTLRALLRRRVRVVTGVAQADQMGLRSSGSKTSFRTLGTILAQEPGVAPKIVLFLGVSVLGRVLAHRAVASKDFTTWLRDDTSRDPLDVQVPR